MRKRKQITADTVAAVAAENAGHPLDKTRAEAYAQMFEPILEQMEVLRALPLKDIEPAVVFHPVVVKPND